MELRPDPSSPVPGRRSVLLAVLLGWVLPGLGQLYVGRPLKAILFLVAILPAFLVGWALTDFTIVNPHRYGLDFAAQVLLGGPTAGALYLTQGRVIDHLPQWFDVGRLYVQVAGLLNLVAIFDAVGDVVVRNRRVVALRRAHLEAGAARRREAVPAPDVPAVPAEPAEPPAKPAPVDRPPDDAAWPLFPDEAK